MLIEEKVIFMANQVETLVPCNSIKYLNTEIRCFFHNCRNHIAFAWVRQIVSR